MSATFDRLIAAFEKAADAVCELPSVIRENTEVSKKLLSFRQELAGDAAPDAAAEEKPAGKAKSGGRKVTVNTAADTPKIAFVDVETAVKNYIDGEGFNGAEGDRAKRKEAWGALREDLQVVRLKDLPEEKFAEALKKIAELPKSFGKEDAEDEL